jgi:hypothetical protein
MPGPTHLLLPLALVAFEERTEARVHAFSAEAARLDLVQNARLRLSVDDQRNTAALAYAPTLLLLSAGSPDNEVALFHTFDALLTHRYRRGFVSLSQATTFGRNNFRLALAPTTAPDTSSPSSPANVALQPPGAPASRGPVFDEVVWFGSTMTTLTLGQTLTPRLSAYEYANYSVHGGLDSQARALFPTQHQQTLGTGLVSLLSPRDTVTSGIDAQRTSTTGLNEIYLLALRERWQHEFSARTNGTLSVGAAYAVERDPQQDSPGPWLPLAEAGVTTGWSETGTQSRLAAYVGVTPAVDWFSGQLDHRAYANLTLSQSHHTRRWFVTGSAVTSLDQSVDSSLTAVALVIGASQLLSPELTLDSTLSTSWQLFESQDTPAFLWMGTVALTYRPRAWPL